MKFVLILLVFPLFMPIFAQESSQLNEVTNQLQTQINQDNIKELDERVSKLETPQNFENQFISSEEYTKLMDRLYKLENNKTTNDNSGLLTATVAIAIGTIIASLVALGSFFKQSQNAKIQNNIAIEQNNLTKKNTQYQGLLEVMKIFNSDDHAHKRYLIYENYKNGTLYNENGDIRTEALRHMVASVRGAFDNFGILIDVDFINKEHFLSLYCGSVLRMYKVLQQHIEFEREGRKSKYFAVYFEKIFYESKKYWNKEFPNDPEPEPY